MPHSAALIPVVLALVLDVGIVHSLTRMENAEWQADLLTLGVPIMTLCLGLNIVLVTLIRASPGEAMIANKTALDPEQVSNALAAC